MHSVQADVEAFHRAVGQPVEVTPAIRRPEFRATLIMEEAVEACERLTGREISWGYTYQRVEQSLEEVVDGLCDVLCVVYGTAAECGVDLEPFWDEVHRTNMAKQGGPVRADGKRLKPEGWKPPRIAELLDELQNGSRNVENSTEGG